MMKRKIMNPALLACTAGLLVLPASAATLMETFEGEATGAFDGAADLTWVGDTGNFSVDTAAWPVSNDFNGSRSLRSNAVAGTSSIVTDISSLYSAGATVDWSVYVSGTSRNIWPSTYNFSLVLMSDSADAAKVTAGTMNGYRLRLGDDNTAPGAGSHDTFYFEEANGAGWATIQTVELNAGVDISQGWNLAASRDSSGEFTWGFATGAYGEAVTLGNAITDGTTTASTYSGMTWRATNASNADTFGFDEFSVSAVPEPSSAALLGLGGLALILRRRK